ncbi:DUF998 domain-containing protein [Enterococcus nangangensis]|uniref:DUF998 domain-containing protein n=1 Tax=Enterococcus nangangensis TaxID=2559926 RepID=UPI0010F94D07|nr:DUF998 domain-containing protein [Enterococcus nangangensis]
MKFLKKYYPYFLLGGTLSDFLMPYLLGFFVPHYHHLTQLISYLGEKKSPVAEAANVWSVVSGCLLIIGALGSYFALRKVQKLSAILFSSAITLFALGDCIINGLFTVSHEHPLITAVHDAGSGVGFIALLVAPLILSYYYQMQQQKSQRNHYFGYFLVAAFFNLLYAAPHLSFLRETFLTQHRGLWQRLALFTMYLPVFIFAYQKQQKRS